MILTVTLSPSLDKTYVVEGLTEDRLNYAKKHVLLPGSKGINVSRMLSTLAVPNLAIGLCGGTMGKLFRELLEMENVQFDYVDTKSEIRFNVKIADIKNGTFTDVNEQGEEVEESEFEAFLSLYDKYLEQASHVVIAGSIREGMSRDVYNQFICMGKERGKKILFDCSGESLKFAIGERPYLISPNIHELSDYVGKELTTQDEVIHTLCEIHNSGIAYAVATLGEKGAILVCDKGVYKMTPPAVEAINTTGAGDSFLAGMLYGMVRGGDAYAMLKYAGSFSSFKVTKFDTTMPSMIEAFSLLDQILVEKLI